MRFLQAYKMAIKSILSNKGRSFLTMLGVIIGVAAVIAAVAFAQGSTKNVTSSIQSLGTNLVTINLRDRGSNRTVTYEELNKFKEENSDLIASIAPTVTSSVTAKNGNKSRSTSIIGTSPEYETIKSRHISSGRFISQLDIDYNLKTALVGTAVVNDLFKGENAIGQTIKINGSIFKIVGVLEQIDNGQDSGDDDKIIIPVTAATKLTSQSRISNFSVLTSSEDKVDQAVTKLKEFLYTKYKNENSYSVMSAAQMLSTLSSITDSMMLILGGIATISLIVGGIGIMNIMLVSVTERTREIGIRKAIGAKKRNILIQFLIEALMVTGMGGIIGILLGLAIIKFVIGGLNLVPESYSLTWILISFGFSLLVGVVFGIYPARKAAKLNPIDALMYE
ncbi:macrolide export ATP-binding/permease protein MacB [Clostridium homopropionicum DSM 5847]|uniref:Macrolide export ATP-binding/permease protein MacB n=1 Tax=Clostridium homopropionicum DSM 5847 TaxID=1121318 RepID=A0A0L6ZCC3_9CLOT|nr:ABC transporter permease [Clostridium homopropionicum]KOA20602.1 macrolide export ATP-binding/permease protein MacB [Clostridium homopropionicum DSM 5847]SFF93410.1 putative ABC transport system permease protein [Clostridium homopropionicum]